MDNERLKGFFADAVEIIGEVGRYAGKSPSARSEDEDAQLHEGRAVIGALMSALESAMRPRQSYPNYVPPSAAMPLPAVPRRT